MALYKDSRLLSLGTGVPFDTIYPPGHQAPAAGIYHCAGCGNEVVSHRDSSLPPENHPPCQDGVCPVSRSPKEFMTGPRMS